MKAIGIEVGKGAALLVIALLFIFTGLVAASGSIPDRSRLVDETTATVGFLYLLPSFMFLAYRQMYSSPRDQNDDDAAFKWLVAWVCVGSVVMLLIVALAPYLSSSDLAATIFLTCPLFYYCYESYALYRSQGPAADKRQKSFENLIFIPAFLLCMVNFSLGLLLKRRIGQPLETSFVTTLFEGAPYVIACLAVVFLYYRVRVRAAYIYVAFPLAVIGIGLFAFFAFELTSAKYIALAIMMTFFLGFGEVTKNLYFERDISYGERPASEFLMQGANWSGVVYPTIFLFSPVLFIEMSFLPIIVIVYVFVLFWLWLTPKQKTSELALAVSFAVGYGTPIAFVLSIARLTDFPMSASITDLSPLQTLLTLIALIGFMAGLLRLSKDLFGLNLHAFTSNIWNRSLYSNEAACLFLLLVMSLLVCVVLTCAWFVLFVFPEAAGQSTNRIAYSNRLVFAGIAIVVLGVLAVLLTIFRPTRLEAIIAATDAINTMTTENPGGPSTPPTTAAAVYNWLATARLLASSGRLSVSWIAGFAAALIVYRSPSFSWPNIFVAFTSLTLVTMSGFLMNDIYDREKDRMAGKLRPIATGQISVVVAWRAVAALVSLSLGLTYLSFGFGSALWIAVIASALGAYSPVAGRLPLIKGLYTAVLATSPFLLLHNAVGFALPSVILASLLFYFVFREAVLDAVDVQGDVAAGVRTVAFFLGRNMTVSHWLDRNVCNACCCIDSCRVVSKQGSPERRFCLPSDFICHVRLSPSVQLRRYSCDNVFGRARYFLLAIARRRSRSAVCVSAHVGRPREGVRLPIDQAQQLSGSSFTYFHLYLRVYGRFQK